MYFISSLIINVKKDKSACERKKKLHISSTFQLEYVIQMK